MIQTSKVRLLNTAEPATPKHVVATIDWNEKCATNEDKSLLNTNVIAKRYVSLFLLIVYIKKLYIFNNSE